MTVKITDVTTPDDDTWEALWQQCPWATRFESPDWSRLWEEVYAAAFRTDPLMFSFSDGIQAVLPGGFFTRMFGRIKARESSPGGTYGGPLCSSLPTRSHLTLLVNRLHSITPNHFFRINPYLLHTIDTIDPVSGLSTPLEPETDNDLDRMNEYSDDFTQTIPLRVSNEEFTTRMAKRRVAYYARRLRKEGFVVHKAGMDDLGTFYAIYEQAQQRWKHISRAYPMDFFRALANRDQIDFWGCYSSDGHFVGGGFMALSNHHAISWLTLMDTRVLSKCMNDYFYFELINYYRNRGFQWFDMNPSGGNPGVEQFKDKFQPARLPAPIFQNRSRLVKATESIRGLFRIPNPQKQ